MLTAEPSTQFLARMIVATREGNQINSDDARRLSDLATYGDERVTTMPEERRQPTKGYATASERVVG